LNQTSEFGAVLDYSVDILTHSAMLMAIGSLVPWAILPLTFVLFIEVIGCVVSMYLTASGRYWKQTDSGTPFILKKVIVNNNYTNFGRVMLMFYHAFWACSWLACHSSAYYLLWWLLLPPSIINFFIHLAIAYEGIRKWQEMSN